MLSAEIDANNWKAHWRQGVALLAMVKKKFRTQQAIEAFERCLRCSSLPPSKADEVKTELRRARTRLAQQEEEVNYHLNVLSFYSVMNLLTGCRSSKYCITLIIVFYG